jgi:hypothetical protein
MTIREVKELSIKKWKWLKARAGITPSAVEYDIVDAMPENDPELYARLTKCLFLCPLCQLHRSVENNGEYTDTCNECIIYKITGKWCGHHLSDYALFIRPNKTKTERKQYAQNIIDAIKQWDITGIENKKCLEKDEEYEEEYDV